MAILDNVVSLLGEAAQAESDAEGRVSAALAAIQATVANLTNQVSLLTADAADPAIVAQVESDLTALIAKLQAIAPAA